MAPLDWERACMRRVVPHTLPPCTVQLAVAQLEAEKFATELSREKLVTETLQHELVRITQPLRPDHQGNGATSGGAGSSWGRR